MKELPKGGLYAITDCNNLDLNKLVDYSRKILANGAAILQYRNNFDTPSGQYAKAKKLQELCHQYNVPFIVNDNIELAQSLKADGVHLGKYDIECNKARKILGPRCIIGISCYDQLQLAENAVKDGANYVAFGAFYPSTSKNVNVRVSIKTLQRASQSISLPIVAIGGITPDNGSVLLNAGASFIAVISGLFNSDEPDAATRKYVKLFHRETSQHD